MDFLLAVKVEKSVYPQSVDTESPLSPLLVLPPVPSKLAILPLSGDTDCLRMRRSGEVDIVLERLGDTEVELLRPVGRTRVEGRL